MQDPPEATWFTDANGDPIGVVVDTSGDAPVIKVVDSSGDVASVISASDAPRVIELLRNGVAFMDITGAQSFQFNPEER